MSAVCRPDVPHVRECGPSSDRFYCACGCSGDDAWCYRAQIEDLTRLVALLRDLVGAQKAYMAMQRTGIPEESVLNWLTKAGAAVDAQTGRR